MSLAKNSDSPEHEVVYYDPKEAKLEEMIKKSGGKSRSKSKNNKKSSVENVLAHETP